MVPARRLDQTLVELGLCSSREKARRAVMAGLVEVGGRRVDKPGTAVKSSQSVRLLAPAEPFVSRAGRKLQAALDRFEVDPSGLRCLDVGASTGGFTDCLLQRGAAQVTALDVGYGLIDARLRADPRVEVIERTNARHLPPGYFETPFELVVVDVSFISLIAVVPALLPYLAPGGRLLTLIKPQFEVGKGAVGKGGIVRDETLRARVIAERAAEIAVMGLRPALELIGTFDSPVTGATGNREAFALFVRPLSGRRS